MSKYGQSLLTRSFYLIHSLIAGTVLDVERTVEKRRKIGELADVCSLDKMRGTIVPSPKILPPLLLQPFLKDPNDSPILTMEADDTGSA